MTFHSRKRGWHGTRAGVAVLLLGLAACILAVLTGCGYTRILRVGYRRGDSAEVAQVELVGSEYDPKAVEAKAAEEAAKPKSKGLGERLKATAQRVRGKSDQGGSKAQAGGQTKGATRKTTTPRKAGGS